MDFSKNMLTLHIMITVCLCVVTIVGAYKNIDMTAVGTLAGVFVASDGVWGGFYLWKAKNENRAKYAQKFIKLFAKEYGVDAAIQVAEIVLKD